MKKPSLKILTILLTALLAMNALPAFAEEAEGLEEAYFNAVLTGLFENYHFEADKEKILRAVAGKALAEHPELLEDLINVAADSFDPYTDYYTPAEVEAFSQFIGAEYVGIGVTIRRIAGGAVAQSIINGSPAAIAGIQPGDVFLSVNGRDVTDCTLDELTELVKGPEGTQVHLVMLRGDEEHAFTVTRATVHAGSVSYQIIDGEIGYMLISVFNNLTPAEVAAADAYFRANGIKKLIVDLRDNPGGGIISVVQTLGFFVPQGKTVVTTEYKNSETLQPLRSVGDLTDGPYYELAVLVNEGSASGAELFAGNIRDYELGTLIGAKTYGKGTVQEFMSLLSTEERPMGQIKLTMAEYILPGGEKIHGKGIEPDIRILNRKVKLDTSEMEPLVYQDVYKEGDQGASVLALKQRFSVMGYFVGELDDVYDRELALAVKQFQQRVGLPDTGTMDIETQILFGNVIQESRVLQDRQLEKALEVLKGTAK
ncbi:MAG: PDZ domain-containing protein [Ruminococcaceae bacterium]|nr:PDZ domain-containing protein [Oscillospiraceae bacterium]